MAVTLTHQKCKLMRGVNNSSSFSFDVFIHLACMQVLSITGPGRIFAHKYKIYRIFRKKILMKIQGWELLKLEGFQVTVGGYGMTWGAQVGSCRLHACSWEFWWWAQNFIHILWITHVLYHGSTCISSSCSKKIYRYHNISQISLGCMCALVHVQ